MGFRLFDNPAFTGEAVKKWKEHLDPSTGEAVTFYQDAAYSAAEGPGPALSRGVSWLLSHCLPSVLPPENPAEPKYENLASAIGNQYIKEGATFAPNVRAGDSS